MDTITKSRSRSREMVIAATTNRQHTLTAAVSSIVYN